MDLEKSPLPGFIVWGRPINVAGQDRGGIVVAIDGDSVTVDFGGGATEVLPARALEPHRFA